MNAEHVIIQTASQEDLEDLQRLSEENGSSKPLSYWKLCRARMADGELEVLTARRGDLIYGYGFLNWQPKYRVYQQQNIPEIQDLNVLPPYRGQGIAAQMIQACEEAAKKKGCQQIGISFGLTKEFGPAQRLYIKLGYLPDGFGVTYDREQIPYGQIRPIDEDLCLMLVKAL